MADLDVVEDESVSSVGADADVLHGSIRGAVARGGVARVDRDGVGRRAGALDLKVAADTGAGVRNDVPVDPWRLRDRCTGQLAPEHGDQVLVVRAVPLVGVGDRTRLVLVVSDLVLV